MVRKRIRRGVRGPLRGPLPIRTFTGDVGGTVMLGVWAGCHGHLAFLPRSASRTR